MIPYYSILNEKNGWHEITKAADAPNQKHWVIMIFDKQSVYHEADQRSIDTGGSHGYGAYTSEYLTHTIHYTLSEQSWLEAIEALFLEKPNRTDMLAYIVQKVAQISPAVIIK